MPAPTSRPMLLLPRCYFVEKAFAELHAGRTATWADFKVPEEAIGCGFHEAVRGVLSHHVVIREGKIANYHPYRRHHGTPTRARTSRSRTGTNSGPVIPEAGCSPPPGPR